MRLPPRTPPLLPVTALLAAFCCQGPAHAADPADARPSFILCMADDQGWGDVAYNGHPTLKTPVLDEMAATGLRMDRFYAAAPVCSPTRGSVLTGRHPNRFGCFKWGHMLRPQEITIAEALREAGYATGHFGKWHLGPMRAGAPNSPGDAGFDTWVSSPNFYENSPLFSRNGTVIETDGESSMVTVEAALPFIRQAVSDGRPFLAVIWFGNPHTPHQARPELQALYPDQPPAVQNYLGEITGIDRAMGRLRKELRAMGAAKNTVLWYTSDNGARRPGSTGGLRGQKGSVWEGGLRVPAVVEWPAAIKSPRRSDLPASTVDIYPTLLELAGVKNPAPDRPIDGESLKRLFVDAATDTRTNPLGFWDYPTGGRPMRSTQLLQQLRQQQRSDDEGDDNAPAPAASHPLDAFPGHAAWLDTGWKLHRIAGRTGDDARLELYNLNDDPTESTDLADREPARVRRMAEDLAAWQRSVVQSLNGDDYRSP